MSSAPPPPPRRRRPSHEGFSLYQILGVQKTVSESEIKKVTKTNVKIVGVGFTLIMVSLTNSYYLACCKIAMIGLPYAELSPNGAATPSR